MIIDHACDMKLIKPYQDPRWFHVNKRFWRMLYNQRVTSTHVTKATVVIQKYVRFLA